MRRLENRLFSKLLLGSDNFPQAMMVVWITSFFAAGHSLVARRLKLPRFRGHPIS